MLKPESLKRNLNINLDKLVINYIYLSYMILNIFTDNIFHFAQRISKHLTY